VYFKAAITQMCPRMPWERAADPIGSAETPLGTTGISHIFGGIGTVDGRRLDSWCLLCYRHVLGIWFNLSFFYIGLVFVEFSSDPPIYCHHVDSGNLTQILDSYSILFYTTLYYSIHQSIVTMSTQEISLNS